MRQKSMRATGGGRFRGRITGMSVHMASELSESVQETLIVHDISRRKMAKRSSQNSRNKKKKCRFWIDGGRKILLGKLETKLQKTTKMNLFTSEDKKLLKKIMQIDLYLIPPKAYTVSKNSLGFLFMHWCCRSHLFISLSPTIHQGKGCSLWTVSL